MKGRQKSETLTMICHETSLWSFVNDHVLMNLDSRCIMQWQSGSFGFPYILESDKLGASGAEYKAGFKISLLVQLSLHIQVC